MITLSRSSKSHNAARAHKTSQPAVETAGSLAMLYNKGLLTIGQYDEFISTNPFAVDYSQYANFEGDGSDIAYGGFLADFSNAVSTLGEANFVSAGGGFGGFSDCGGASCGGGGFTSVC